MCGGGGIGGHCDENWTTLLAWVAFVFLLPRVPAVQCGAGWHARGKGPICCMRLFQTRYSTGCHLFGETQGRWDYGEEGVCVCEGGTEVNFSRQHVFFHPIVMYVCLM